MTTNGIKYNEKKDTYSVQAQTEWPIKNKKWYLGEYKSSEAAKAIKEKWLNTHRENLDLGLSVIDSMVGVSKEIRNHNRKCKGCLGSIPPERIIKRSTYCSDVCYAITKEKLYKLNIGIKNTRSNVGDASELLVCSDLILRGYYVFKSICTNNPVDIIAIKSDRLLKIEVKTGRRNHKTKNLSYSKPTNNQYDILAVYDSLNQSIIYMPDILE